MKRSRRGALGAALVVLVTLGVAGAQGAVAPGVIKACVKVQNGQPRIVGAAVVCDSNETPLEWNAEGIQGPPGPPGPPGASALSALLQPYLGTFALYLDGAFAAPLASVDGCTPKADVILFREGGSGGGVAVQKLLGRVRYGACVVELGLNMTPALRSFIAGSLAVTGARSDMSIVRDQAGGPGGRIDLDDVVLQKLTVPELDTTSATPVRLRLELRPRLVQQSAAASAPLGSMALEPIDPSTLGLAIGGITSAQPKKVGPLEFDVTLAEFRQTGPTGAEEIVLIPTGIELPDPSVTYAGASPAVAPINGWLSSFVGGASSPRPQAVLTAAGGGRQLSLDFGRTGPYAGDLFYGRRPDGSRTYELFAETVVYTGA
jgi:hypothetical protein